MKTDRTKAALNKALQKVDLQQQKVGSLPLDDPQRAAEIKVLETLRQSASLARMASLFADDDEARAAFHQNSTEGFTDPTVDGVQRSHP